LTRFFKYDYLNTDMNTARAKLQRGFTLIELLVVIGILAVLLAITLIAINPARQFSQANNTQRSSDVNAILNAVWQYAVDNNGNLTGLNIPVAPTAPAVIGSGVGQINLCSDVAPTYIAQLPVDPQTGTWTDCATYNTAYTIVQENGRVTVAAPDTEIPPATVDISVSR
jgi:prepilin-type N-terminal cleavage/methylation domain-containing protein